jgi:DNA-binding transcriptional regulator of glucitol operon
MRERTSDESSRRLWTAVGCAVALVVGLGMAYWQWSRYESASGTLQNLGYVLQWPLFGFFPAFMVWRIYLVARRERGDPAAAPSAESVAETASEPQPTTKRSFMAYVPPTAEDIPAADTAAQDPALAKYNALLADLNNADESTATDDESTAEGQIKERHNVR